MKLLSSLIFISFLNFTHTPKATNQELVGVWQCNDYDIRVDVFSENNEINARLLSFPCTHKVKMSLKDHKDVRNPDKTLRDRSLLNIPILFGLKPENDYKWSNGNVYVPTTGQTLRASLVRMTGNQVKITGFIGFEFIGKTLIFNRVL